MAISFIFWQNKHTNFPDHNKGLVYGWVPVQEPLEVTFPVHLVSKKKYSICDFWLRYFRLLWLFKSEKIELAISKCANKYYIDNFYKFYGKSRWHTLLPTATFASHLEKKNEIFDSKKKSWHCCCTYLFQKHDRNDETSLSLFDVSRVLTDRCA